MFKNLADETAILLIAHNLVAEEKREAYTYGLELFFEKIFFYLIIFLISLLAKTFLFSALFVFSYKMLRQYTGGFHCKTAEMCLVVSVLIYLITMLLYLLNLDSVEFVLAISSLVSTIIIFIFSPRENINRPLESDEKRKYWIISIAIAVIMTVVSAISYIFNISFLFYSASCSLTADAVLIILTLGRCKDEEDTVESFEDDGRKEHCDR